MKRGAKRKKIPSDLRRVVSQNVKALMDSRYSQSSNRAKQLAKDSVLTLSTVQRVLKQSTGATLDTIDQLAKAFDLSPYQLLVSGLDPTNPAVLHNATECEKQFYARLATLLEQRPEQGRK